VYFLPSEEHKERRIFASISIGMCKQRKSHCQTFFVSSEEYKRDEQRDEQYKSNEEFDLYMAMTLRFCSF
jgi:hypothetical protein